MRKLLCVLVLSTMATAQTEPPKKEPKPFKVPEYNAIDPLIAKDEGCAKDLAKATQMEGLEQRKFLADLITYGCVRVGQGHYFVNILDLRQFDEGTKKIMLSHVKLLSTSSPLTDSKNQIIDGWILSNNLITTDVIQKVLVGLQLQKRNQ